MTRSLTKKISVKATEPPKLTDKEWNVLGVIGLAFLLMAVLQLASFGEFSDWLKQVGFSQPKAWGVVLVLAELWAAAGFFKLKLSPLFRIMSSALALLVSGFWFIQNIRLVSGTMPDNLGSSGFFGSFLEQAPSWWTVLEAGLLLFAVIYSLDLFKNYFHTHTS